MDGAVDQTLSFIPAYNERTTPWHSVAARPLWPFLHQGRQIKVGAPHGDFAVSDFKHAYSNVGEKNGSNIARSPAGHPGKQNNEPHPAIDRTTHMPN